MTMLEGGVMILGKFVNGTPFCSVMAILGGSDNWGSVCGRYTLLFSHGLMAMLGGSDNCGSVCGRYTLLFSHGNAVDIGQMSSFLLYLSVQLKSDILSYDYSGSVICVYLSVSVCLTVCLSLCLSASTCLSLFQCSVLISSKSWATSRDC